MLTADEIEKYNRDGYVIPGGFCLNDAVLKELRVAVDKVLENNPGILPDRMINPHLNGGRPYGVNGTSVSRYGCPQCANFKNS